MRLLTKARKNKSSRKGLRMSRPICPKSRPDHIFTFFEKSAIQEITDIAREHDALLLSDEVYEYQVYEGEHCGPASEFDHVITVKSFSKSHAMTGWRLGYVTGPKEVLEGMIKIYQHFTGCLTAFPQNGAVEALRSESDGGQAQLT